MDDEVSAVLETATAPTFSLIVDVAEILAQFDDDDARTLDFLLKLRVVFE